MRHLLARREVIAGTAVGVVMLLVTGIVILRGGEPRPAPVIGMPIAHSRPTSLVASRGLRDQPGSRKPHVPRQIVVRFDPDATEEERARARRVVGGVLVREIAALDAEVLRLPKEISVSEARGQLAADPAVLYSEPNFIYRATAVRPNDPLFPQLWGEENSGQVVGSSAGSPDADIDAPEAWGVTTGRNDVTIAVVDSGVAYDHPDLAPSIWTNPGESGGGRESNGVDDDRNGYVDDVRGWDWVGGDNQPRDLNGHGTHVAGTIAARGNDGIGVSGVTWNAGILPLRTLNAAGSGTSANIATAFTYAGRYAPIVNVSLGGPSFSQTILDSMANAPNTLFVVAAGNEAANNDSTPSYPCNYELVNIVCVAATTSSDRLASYSNYGSTSVDLAAPGSGILSTVPSFSSPVQETFETDFAGRWITGGTNNTWSRATDQYGGYVTDSPGQPYAPGTDSWIQTAQRVTVAAAARCSVQYALRLDLDNTDRLRVEGSPDGSSWTVLGSWTGSTSGRFASVTNELSKLGEATSIHVRFRLLSDADATNRAGVDIDDVTVKCAEPVGPNAPYAYLSGTSMAAPHVSGVAALVLTLVPGTRPVDLARALLRSGDAVAELAGKSVTGKRLNAAGAVQTVAPAAPSPSPTALATSPASSPASLSSSPAPADSPTSSPAPGTTPGSPTPQGADPTTSSPGPESTTSPPTTTAPPRDQEGDPPPEDPGDEREPGDGEGPGDPPPPTEPPREDEPQLHERKIKLQLRRHLVARGRIVAPDGATECLRQRSLKIVRNGRLLAETRVGTNGRFRIRLPDLPGRYAAKIRARAAGGQTSDRCGAARSAVEFHLH